MISYNKHVVSLIAIWVGINDREDFEDEDNDNLTQMTQQ